MKVIKPEDRQPDNNTHHSVFEERMNEIQKIIDGKFDEKVNEETLQASLDMINSLLPIAERNYRRFKIDKAASTVSMLLNQQRELTNDLRALQSFNDRSLVIKTFVTEAATLVLENMLDSGAYLRDSLINKLNLNDNPAKREMLEELIGSFLKEHGKYIVESTKSVEARIDGFITKTPTIPKTRKLIK